MRRNIKFESNNEIKDFKNYSDKKIAIAKVCVLSTAKNSHNFDISEEVLRRDIGSIKGNFLVADVKYGENMTHTPTEVPVGYFLPDYPIEFEEVQTNEGKVVKAWAYAALSKMYAKKAYEMFVNDNHRATSIEMQVELADDEHTVLGFDAYSSTILGKFVMPSCKDAEISLVRFAEEMNKAIKEDSYGTLQNFAKQRSFEMAESKTYKIDKSKDALSDKPWGEVDKTDLRNKIMEASNRASLIKSVYMLVEDGWEKAPSEHLKYPVMELKGDTFVYNRGGLASALGYAKKENETKVISKIEKIYEKLGLGKEENGNMSKEIEFAAVDIGDMWGKLWDVLRAKYPDSDWGSVYRIDGIYEENNKKFAIIRHKGEDVKYRLDFSLTEEGLTLSDEIIKVELEIIETDEVKKFAEPKNVEQYQTFEVKPDDDDSDDDEMSCDQMKEEMTRLQSEIENRDNIIMEKDKELEELREFKRGIEEKEKAMCVESILSEVKEFMSEDSMKTLREEGMALNKDQIDAFSNKVKAQAFEFTAKISKTNKSDEWSFSAPKTVEKKSSSNVWDRIKEY